jgi:D-arabinose 1-dehydrogenase-like Zn-dependent alcohol dehydrogenase
MQRTTEDGASVGVGTYGDTYGECYYCRDGESVRLYRYEKAYRYNGDIVADTEMVCRGCYNWLGTASHE